VRLVEWHSQIPGQELDQGVDQVRDVLRELREARWQDDPVPIETGNQQGGGRDQIIGDAPGPVRDSRHGVDNMAVETGKETEPVLAWKPVSLRPRIEIRFVGLKPSLEREVEHLAVAVNARVHGNAARFTAWNAGALEDLDLEASLDELLCGTQPGDATTQNDNSPRHADSSPTS
jgi:hypothetical protein